MSVSTQKFDLFGILIIINDHGDLKTLLIYFVTQQINVFIKDEFFEWNACNYFLFLKLRTYNINNFLFINSFLKLNLIYIKLVENKHYD